MTITDILIVLFYSAKPYWWLALIAIILLFVSYIIGKGSVQLTTRTSIRVSVVAGIVIGLCAPYITTSKLSYVSTMTDWFALIAIMVAMAIYCFINFKLISRQSS